MDSLFMDAVEIEVMNEKLSKLEKEYGSEYHYDPEYSEFSCRCSGPGQSCVWH
ncbi:MAG: hypothetical protein IIY78_03765 [Clostridia bacterium]|nr:hypothetical protein [Clostridia bacterium]